jgi:glycosyltransferase involved in cell wall biosynthesis
VLKEFEGDLHPERLYQVYIKLGRAYLNTRDEGEAVKYAFKAAKLNNKIADAYLIIGEVYANIGNWKELEYYAKKILEIGKPNTPQAINEADYMLVPLRMLIQAYLQLGNLSEAIETANKLVKIAPNNPQFIKERHEIIRDRSKGDYVIGLAKMYKYMVNNNRMEEAIKLLALIPDELKEHPMLQNIVEEIEYDHKRKTEKIKLKTKKKIDFLVGPHFEKWNGESDVTTGIGGSEGMTIQMARELAKLGNAVTVWCETDGGVFDGVEYSNYKEWSTDRPTDVLIGVRGWGLSAFQNLMNAKKQYLWLHDTDYGDYPQSSFYYPNRVFVLSEFHKEIIMQNQGLTDASNFYVTRNALNKSVMDEINGSETLPCRDMSRIIYASSYDRGLDNALRMWPKIKKEVPEAELHIFYGWNTFDALMNQRGSARMQQYKNMILELMRQDGVFEHGRISQKHLYNEFLKSNIWFYPTEFEEISCINAMTAQALGTFPVCTPKAALNETVSNEYGIKVGLDQIADALIYKLKQTKDEEKTNRFDMIEWAGKRFDIVPLAKEWDRLFIND